MIPELMSHVRSNDVNDTLFYLEKPTQKMRIKIATSMIKEDIDKLPGHTLLSIGCSTGDVELLFNEMGLLSYGVDGDYEALKEAQKKGISVVQMDLKQTFPYRKNVFDFVFAGEIIEHIMNTRVFLTDVRRVMKQGAKLILTTPNLARIEDRLRFLFGKTPKHTTPIHDYLYLHIRPFTADSLKRALAFTGFEVERLESNYVYFGGLKAGPFSRLLAQMFPGIGKALIVKAHKI